MGYTLASIVQKRCHFQLRTKQWLAYLADIIWKSKNPLTANLTVSSGVVKSRKEKKKNQAVCPALQGGEFRREGSVKNPVKGNCLSEEQVAASACMNTDVPQWKKKTLKIEAILHS